MNRGAAGQILFREEIDFKVFLRMVRHTAKKFDLMIHAFCLMPNHFHLLLQLMQINLEAALHFLETSYAVYFNQKYERWGHVYARPFKSLECSTEDYYLELIRYIHLNPVRAGLVSDASAWAWSSHRALQDGGDGLIETKAVLGHFGADTQTALDNYRGFLSRTTDRDTFTIARALYDSKEEINAFDPASEAYAVRMLDSINAAQNGDRPKIVHEARSLGFSITEIAAYLNISRPAVWKIEKKLVNKQARPIC